VSVIGALAARPDSFDTDLISRARRRSRLALARGVAPLHPIAEDLVGAITVVVAFIALVIGFIAYFPGRAGVGALLAHPGRGARFGSIAELAVVAIVVDIALPALLAGLKAEVTGRTG